LNELFNNVFKAFSFYNFGKFTSDLSEKKLIVKPSTALERFFKIQSNGHVGLGKSKMAENRFSRVLVGVNNTANDNIP
jgi:hypothetical protein